ncbi:hypothetical protein [Bacillus sp. AFS041924]|uniref:hypothetical protein n=1 Tax=Bacillus sp. AFS041924 TaxID=2033503 RepID=UPI00268BDE67
MNPSGKRNNLISEEAILLAAFSYQTYLLFFNGTITLPKGFELMYIIHADVNIENPTNEVFGFIAESKKQNIIAFRGSASYPTDLIAAYDILQVDYLLKRVVKLLEALHVYINLQETNYLKN